MANLSEVLTGLMFDKNVTSQKLASDLNVTVGTINRWKGDRSGIKLTDLIKLCKYFGCSLDYLVGKTEQDIKPSKFELENFGVQVRKVMKSKGISSYVLRRDTQFASSRFVDWDKGADPKLSTLIELANYFGCSLDELVGLE